MILTLKLTFYSVKTVFKIIQGLIAFAVEHLAKPEKGEPKTH